MDVNMQTNVRFFRGGSFAGVLSRDPLSSSSRSHCPNPLHEIRNKRNGSVRYYLSD